MFYDCSNLSGGSPEFWNPSVFAKLETNSNGYYGALYNCAKLSNYTNAENISSNWVMNLGWNRDY